jgi:predicted AAA+ superfamily ATPase
MELKRKIYSNLLRWKKEQGKTALLIEGARRVGKTTIAEEFGKNEYKSYILIDFSIASDEMKSIFIRYASSLNDFFFFLSTLTNITLHPRNTLIIFDEVQLFPQARQLIKHLVKDNRYDYIETGSLLSIKQNVKDILIPSEERALIMHPLDFEEFCTALGHKQIIKIIKDHFDELKPLGPLHSQTMKLFRQYLLVGGMPQAVLEFIHTNDYTKVDQIKRDILRLYRNDITKYAKGYESKVLQIFDEIPAQLSKHKKKFRLVSISKDARFREYEDAFMWLDEAMLTNTCFNSDDPQIGLSLYKDRLTLKLFMADTGLLISHAYDLTSNMHTEIAQKIITDQLEVNHGMLFENVVAQMLRANNKKLYFYSRLDNENSKNTMEIDFLILDPNKPTKISPIEVKSSKRYKTSSLNKFKTKFNSRIGQSYLLHTKDVMVKDNIHYLPIYMAMFL